MLLGLVMALSLTGYLLPWDQKGYWATQVATNIAGNLPGIGRWAQKIIVGGPEYGNHTLTRFYALHVAILPPLVIIFIVLHLVVFRRHGVTAPEEPPPGPNTPEPVEGWFWPDQAFRDLLVSLVIFGIMLFLVISGHGSKIPASEDRSFYDKVAHAGLDGRVRTSTLPPTRVSRTTRGRSGTSCFSSSSSSISRATWNCSALLSFPTAPWCFWHCCRCSATAACAASATSSACWW